MNAFKTTVLAAVMAAFAAGAAQAADADAPVVPADDYQNMGLYLRADAGWSFLTWSGGDDDSNWAIGGGAGYRFDDNFRADLRVDYAGKYDIGSDQDMAITTVLGNAYYDFANDTAFTPYLGAGVGYGWANVSNGSDDDGFAFALMAGVAVDLTDNIAVDLEYRFRDIVVSGSDPMEQQILGGFRFEF